MEDQSNSTSICLFQSNSLAKFLKAMNFFAWTVSGTRDYVTHPVHKAAERTHLWDYTSICNPAQMQCNVFNAWRCCQAEWRAIWITTPVVGCKWDSRLPHPTAQKLRPNSPLKLQSLSYYKSQCHGWESSPLPARWYLTSHLLPRPICSHQILFHILPRKDGPVLWGPETETRCLQMSVSNLPEGRPSAWTLPPRAGVARFSHQGCGCLRCSTACSPRRAPGYWGTPGLHLRVWHLPKVALQFQQSLTKTPADTDRRQVWGVGCGEWKRSGRGRLSFEFVCFIHLFLFFFFLTWDVI